MNTFVNYSNTNRLNNLKLRGKRSSPGADMQTTNHFYRRHGDDCVDAVNIRNMSNKPHVKAATPSLLGKHLHIYYSNDNNNLHAVNSMNANHRAANKSKQIQINEHKLLQLRFNQRIVQLSSQIAFEPVVRHIVYHHFRRSGSVGANGNGGQLEMKERQKGIRTHSENKGNDDSYEKNKQWSCIRNNNLLKKQRMHFVFKKINYKIKHKDNENMVDNNGDTLYSTSRCKWNCNCGSGDTNVNNNNINSNSNSGNNKYDKPKINLDDVLLNYNTNIKRSLSCRKIHPYQLKLSPFISHHIKYMPKS